MLSPNKKIGVKEPMLGKTYESDWDLPCAVTVLGKVKHKIDKGTQTQTERMILNAVEAGKFPYISLSVRCELIAGLSNAFERYIMHCMLNVNAFNR